MPDVPVAPAPSAPSAPAPAAPSAPAPAAAAPTPVAPSAPAPVSPDAPAVAVPAAPTPTTSTPPASPEKYDPQTAGAPPNSNDYSQDPEGLAQFIAENTAWSLAHPEEAAKIRERKLAAEESGLPSGEQTTAEAGIADAVKTAEGGEQATPEGEKAAEAVQVTGASPAKIDEWTGKSPELKAAFEKNPALRDEIMETARFAETMKEVADIVSTKEEAQFAVEHAQRLVSLQTNWMLSGEDPEMVEPAWNQTVDMFTERDANGAAVMGADGKPKLGSDFKPFVRKAGSYAIDDLNQSTQSQITALEARLKGVYPSEEARQADAVALENLGYEKAAFDFVRERMQNSAEAGEATLPKLPPNATPEQVAYQQQLEAQQRELDARQGKQTVEARRAARVALDREVQNAYEAGINQDTEAYINDMKGRGEYLPDFVLTDKWVNPQTGQPTKVSAFGARVYLALNAKINDNPVHAAKLASLQALGAAGKEARIAEVTRLRSLYFPKILQAEVTRIQDGIRASSGQGKTNNTVARMEPQSQGTVTPQTMGTAEIRRWAEAEAAKEPGWDNFDDATREARIITLAAKKRYGG